MQHIISNTAGSKWGQVHFEPFDGAVEPLCGNGQIYNTVEGIKYRKMFPVSQPVNCKLCRKAAEMLIREQLEKLSAAGMEEVLDLIGKMRNGQLVA